MVRDSIQSNRPAGMGGDGPMDIGAIAGSSWLDVATSTRPISPKLYRMGEVVEYSGVSRQTIHNYTTMGLLRESKWTPGGHRLYDESVFVRLDQISRMKRLRKSMLEIREFFLELDELGM